MAKSKNAVNELEIDCRFGSNPHNTEMDGLLEANLLL